MCISTNFSHNSKDGAIVLNRMYVGNYLETNLGHEVINMYKADNGGHYLYLNAYGSFAKKWQGKINYMLLTKYHEKDCVEVLGCAVNLCDVFNYENDEGNATNKDTEISKFQKEYIENNNIEYGGVPLLELFSNSERQNVYITFQSEKVYRVAKDKKIFIHYVPQKRKDINEEEIKIEQEAKIDISNNKSQIDVYLSDAKLALASLNQFFERGNINNPNADYTNLLKIIYDEKLSSFWQELTETAKLQQDFAPRQISIFDICQIQNDENRFSYALKYFIEKYPNLWCDFFKKEYHIELNPEQLKIKREVSALIEEKKGYKKVNSGGRIDLTISDDNTLIIIENKIKSDINSKPSDKKNNTEITQLNRYYNYAKWIEKTDNKKIHLFILAPDYNIPEISDAIKSFYEIITYKKVYNFLQENLTKFEHDINFVAFFNAIHRHTHDNVNDYLYFEMQENFFRRIKEYN